MRRDASDAPDRVTGTPGRRNAEVPDDEQVSLNLLLRELDRWVAARPRNPLPRDETVFIDPSPTCC